MYKISVPTIADTCVQRDRDEIIRQFKEFDADMAILSVGRYQFDEKKLEETLENFKTNAEYFRKEGMEVGTWMWTFLVPPHTTYVRPVTLHGNVRDCSACPTDKDFVKFACDYIKKVAAAGPSFILLDDDFRFGCQDDQPHCLCENHIKMICDMLGEELTREELRAKILSGGKNKYRDAFLKANGDSMRDFARALREAVDEVNPDVRIGICYGPSTWDVDGVDLGELACILAGKTRPLARLAGGIYWVLPHNHWGFSIQDTVEMSRLECEWMKGMNVETFAEGDPHPRPRYASPAAYLEIFDTAMRVAGCASGIQKYGVDYISKAGYETGYAEFHAENRALYKDIEKYFDNKKSVGIRVWEEQHKIENMELEGTLFEAPAQIDHFGFPKSSRTLVNNSIATTYEGLGVVGIAYDENAKYLPDEALDNGMILDIQAAEFLSRRGVDVGVEKFGKSSEAITGYGYEAITEHYIKEDNYVYIHGDFKVYDIELKEGAEVLSDTVVSGETKPVSFRYENEKGQRFLIYNLNTRIMKDKEFRSYARSRQIAEQTEWLSRGKKLPAYIYGCPSLYMQTKEGDDGALAVAMWNAFADKVMHPVVELAKPYKKIKFINCKGKLRGDKVYLSEIPAFGFAGFEVK